jgi:hypothetical protein
MAPHCALSVTAFQSRSVWPSRQSMGCTPAATGTSAVVVTVSLHSYMGFLLPAAWSLGSLSSSFGSSSRSSSPASAPDGVRYT